MGLPKRHGSRRIRERPGSAGSRGTPYDTDHANHTNRTHKRKAARR